MHRISFAPDVSATLRRFSCWITSLLRLLDYLKYAPAFLLGDGTRLGDADEVAHAAFVLLVVDLEPRALLDRLAVEPVRLGRADLDDDRLFHLVRDHRAQADLALAAGLGRRLSCGRGCGVGHEVSSAFLRVRFGLVDAGAAAASTGSGSAATATG